MEKVTLPKEKQIRLPFHVSSVKKQIQPLRTCQICRKNPSPYSCPRCNIPYCSLECYQSPSKHSQCSEPFFKEEIEIEIGSAKGRTNEEKGKMWELLKKFEDGVGQEGILDLDEEGLGDEDEEGSGGENEEEEGLLELQKALEGVDIDSLSPPSLLALLPPHLQAQFLSSLQDSSAEPNPLLQSLLDSEELALEAESPWWMREEDDQDDGAGFKTTTTTRRGKRREPPMLMELPKEVLMMGITEEMGERMVYNVLAVAQAYIHTTLLFQRSPLSLPPSTSTSSSPFPKPTSTPNDEPFTHDPALINLLSLVPFLSDPSSKTLFTSLSQTIVSLKSHATEEDPLPPLPSHLLLLLLLPPLDLSLPHPLSLLLSDLTALLSTAAREEPDAKKRKEIGKTSKKVGFLGGCVRVMGRRRWVELMGDVGKVFAVKEETEEGVEEEEMGGEVGREREGGESALVEELLVEEEGASRFEEVEEVVEEEEQVILSRLRTEEEEGEKDLLNLEGRVGLGEKMKGRSVEL